MAKAAKEVKIITRDNSHVVEGKLYEVGAVVQYSQKFSTRYFVIDMSTEYQEKDYPNFPKFQLTNHRCDLVDVHKLGDIVKVHFSIRGTGSRDIHNNPVVFTNLDVWRIERATPEALQTDSKLDQWHSSNMTNSVSEAEFAANGGEVDDLPF